MYKKCTNSHANGSSGALMRFYGAYGVCGGCVASVTRCAFMAVETVLKTYVVLYAFRSFTIIPNYTTYFAME